MSSTADKEITVFSKEVVTPEYQQQLLKAKAEYKGER